MSKNRRKLFEMEAGCRRRIVRGTAPACTGRQAGMVPGIEFTYLSEERMKWGAMSELNDRASASASS